MQAQAAAGGTPEEKRKKAEQAQRAAEKKAAEDAKRETAELFKPVQVQKVPFGVDPKTVVCQFFKKGHCDKGMRLSCEEPSTGLLIHTRVRQEKSASSVMT